MKKLTSEEHQSRPTVSFVLVIGCFAVAGAMFPSLPAEATHQGRGHAVEDHHETTGTGYAIPGLSFQVFLDREQARTAGHGFDQAQADATA